MTAHVYPDETTRRLLTATTMAATVMSALDATIANVALPHIQGSVSASQDEITWVLTSYIVSTAIFIPLTGWFADRFGRKRVMMVSILVFTLSSALCGLATNLDELVLFRMMQGAGGAALVPMSQAILLDINPPERHGPAMSFWGMGAVLAPIFGPVLGGWLTDHLTWRWVFYINVPVGIATFFALGAFLEESPTKPDSKLDFLGFSFLALAVGLFQLMLDRGQQQDWFSSTEICVEGALALFFLYAFVVQMKTAREPFIQLGLFEDFNFVFGLFFAFIIGVLIFGVLALLPTMLQQVMGYPVVLTGEVSAPRGIGTLISMLGVGFLIKRVDVRILIITGLVLVATSLFMMSGFALQMDDRAVALSGLVSGVGNGLTFTPLSVVAFSTLQARYRNAATAMYTLIRSLGSAIGISALQTLIIRNGATVHARLIEGIRPDNPVLVLRSPDFDFDAPSAVAGLNAEITRQASMVSYIDSYWMMFVVVLMLIPPVFLLRAPRRAPSTPASVHVE